MTAELLFFHISFFDASIALISSLSPSTGLLTARNRNGVSLSTENYLES
jgi:hypothetical protein